MSAATGQGTVRCNGTGSKATDPSSEELLPFALRARAGYLAGTGADAGTVRQRLLGDGEAEEEAPDAQAPPSRSAAADPPPEPEPEAESAPDPAPAAAESELRQRLSRALADIRHHGA